jgi:site-specific recombinase XerD
LRAGRATAQPLRPAPLQDWAASRGHLREITAGDVTAALEPLRGWSRRTTIAALRSLFRFATKRRLVFTNPTTRLKAEDIDRILGPDLPKLTPAAR